jgi:hypothetical protein
VAWRPLVAPAVAIVVLAFCAAETNYVLDRAIPGINEGWQAIPGVPETPRDWIDRALPDGAEAGVVWSPVLEPIDSNGKDVFERAAFWNEGVQRSYAVTARDRLSGLPALPLEVDAGGSVSAPRELPYLAVSATDPALRLRGDVVARAAYGLELIRAERPYRALWSASGGYPDGFSEGTAERVITVHAPGRALELTLRAPAEARTPVPYELRAGPHRRRGALAPGEERPLLLPGGVSEARVRALKGTALQDGRRVGIRVAPVRVR